MDMNSIPPLQLSTSGPVILGPKRCAQQKTEVAFDEVISSGENASDFSNHVDNETGIPVHCENAGYMLDTSEDHRLERLSHKTFLPFNARHAEQENRFNSGCKQCHLKRIGTCFVMVKESAFESMHNSSSTRKALPGEVESNDVTKSLFDQLKQMKPATKFWDVTPQIEDLDKTKKFLRYARHCLLQMQKFICKLQLAISEEKKYKKRLQLISVTQTSFTGRKSDMYDSDDSINSASDNVLGTVKGAGGTVKIPKLGKVYAELQSNFKVWDDLMKVWQDFRSDASPAILDSLLQFKWKIESHQHKMLYLTQKLIQTRLHSLVSCTTVAVTDVIECDWSSVFGARCLKQSCKLIETYNNMLRKASQNNATRRRSAASYLSSSSSVFDNRFSPDVPETLQSFTASRILAELAGPAKQSLGESILQILKVIKHSNDFNIEEESQAASLVNLNTEQIEWARAEDAEFDEDNVITSVGGHEVLSSAYVNLSGDALSKVKQLMFSQGSFIVSFMNCVAGNTSLMRSKLRSKSPRSVGSSQRQTDDVVSAISSDDDDVSSVASSSFFSQLSGADPTTSRKRKTVLWRDSWDQEEVKTSSKSYMAMLVKEGPVATLQAQIYVSLHSKRNPADDDMHCLLSPRYWTDWSSLILDASISNLITLALLPPDVLGSVQSSTTTFTIEKALLSWDMKMCEALAISGADKCGSLPLRGSPPLTKTGLTYIQAVYALMFVMKFYTRDDVTQKAFPRLESTLDSFYRWCHRKIQVFLTSWSLRPLLQISLGDLCQVTTVGLNCLPLIEKCHNLVESRRYECPATLQQATYHLKNIDGIITNMQSLSGECMRMYSTKCKHLAELTIQSTFPSRKLWRQKNLTDHSCPSSYMERSVQAVFAPLCSAVCVLNARAQLTAVPPAVSALLEATVRHIIDNKIRFSVQGALQLQRDMEYVTEYVCSEEAKLCTEVVRAVPMLSSVKRAMWAASTLQRTDTVADVNAKGNYSASRKGGRRRTSRVSAFNGDENDLLQDETRILERQLLALRIQGKNWFSLPCWDDAAD